MPRLNTPIPIDALDDPRLADYVDLRDRDLRRAEEGLFVGEQSLVVEQMLALPGVTRSVLVGAPQLDRLRALVPPDIPLYVAPMALLEKVAGFPLHRGVLAIGVRSALPASSLQDLAGPGMEPRLLLACEEIASIDNIGMLFRVAAAFGVDGVLLSPGCHDPLYRKALRVSIGHALHVPFVRAERWVDALEALRAAGIALLGAAVDDGAIDLDDLPRSRRAALIVGTEFAGLSPAVRRRCDRLVRIPMAPGVDSLNVAVAAGILLHRLRQDRASHSVEGPEGSPSPQAREDEAAGAPRGTVTT